MKNYACPHCKGESFSLVPFDENTNLMKAGKWTTEPITLGSEDDNNLQTLYFSHFKISHDFVDINPHMFWCVPIFRGHKSFDESRNTDLSLLKNNFFVRVCKKCKSEDFELVLAPKLAKEVLTDFLSRKWIASERTKSFANSLLATTYLSTKQKVCLSRLVSETLTRIHEKIKNREIREKQERKQRETANKNIL